MCVCVCEYMLVCLNAFSATVAYILCKYELASATCNVSSKFYLYTLTAMHNAHRYCVMLCDTVSDCSVAVAIARAPQIQCFVGPT